MRFPTLKEISRQRDMTTVFGGYNHQISCQEGQFFDMKNMTSNYFPVLSPRGKRGILKTLSRPQSIIDKEDIWYIDDNVLYRSGDAVLSGENRLPLSGDGAKTMVKMGAYIVIMPDKVWVKVNDDEEPEWGHIENVFNMTEGTVSFGTTDEQGKVIKWNDAEYYKTNKAQDGDYQCTINSNGKPSLKVYSAATGIWMSVISTYVSISKEGIGKGFAKGDGVKITIDRMEDALKNIFLNEEEDGKYSINTIIVERSDDSITIPGIFGDKFSLYDDLNVRVERKMPEVAFMTECNNRLWGCSEDGHEIYCCKLGDVTNWNSFTGISTDAWAATVGSDGKFTGAITYLGYPIFFKEDCLIKVSVSSTGGHQIRETSCRGVQKGSERSLSILNEVLYYKSAHGVCGYSGSLPYDISDDLGDVRYYDGVAGSAGDRYYISMRDGNGKFALFVYDVKNGIWCKEDNTRVLEFCRHSDELLYVDADDNCIKAVSEGVPGIGEDAQREDDFEWYAESGPIGYSSPDNKYVGRINVRITLEYGADVNVALQYDDSDEWEHKFNMSGKGTKTFSIALIPKRCDHFRYRISGKGECKIHSLTKSVEQGSDGL